MRESTTTRELLIAQHDKVDSQDVVKIFWPADLLDSQESGLILGWQNSPHDLFVIDLVSNVYRTGLEQPVDINGLVTKYPISKVTQFCGTQPLSILGQALASAVTNGDHGDYELQCIFDRESIYPAFRLLGSRTAIQLIIFERPDPHRMQYFSMSPVPFDYDQQESLPATDAFIETTCTESMSGLSQRHLNQMNCAREVALVLQENLPQLRSRRSRNRAQSFHDAVRKSVASGGAFWQSGLEASQSAIFDHVVPATRQAMHTIVSCELFLLGYLSLCLHSRLPLLNTALVDISVVARELDFRLKRIRRWPRDYRTLRHRKKDWASITNFHPDYIKFYNGVWLIANDLILGVYIVSICQAHEDSLASTLYHAIDKYTLETVTQMMWWLKGWPAGLKLNSELATFLGDLFLWLLASWRDILERALPYFPLIIRTIGIGGFLGASISIALVSDCLSLLTLQLHMFYYASAKVYSWQVATLISLFHLFRGKKRNVLRHRIDSCDYDLDQLLLGTVLFTILVFLFPTVLVFYLTFAAARIATRFARTGLDMMLAFLVQFPLFGLLLRIKDAKRLPGGLQFSCLEPPARRTATDDYAAVSLLFLEPKPLPLDAMFASFVSRQRDIMGSTLSLGTLVSDAVRGSL